jgi:hypothetical protein
MTADIIADVVGPSRTLGCVPELSSYCEVDLINGLVVEEGRKRGIPTPANQPPVEMTRRIYAGELKPSPSNLGIAMELLRSKLQ